MIDLRPFRAWRPVPHAAHLVGSRSFVSYTADQIKEKLAGNPYSFLHIIHPDGEMPGIDRAGHFDNVRAMFQEFTRKGILERDHAPALYLYEQSCAAFTSRGIIGAVGVGDYIEGRVKRHEHTLSHREELFTDYLDHTAINAEPVLLAMPESPALEAEMDAFFQLPTLFDFLTTDQVRHRFWRVDSLPHLATFRAHFNSMEALYIADGHHRCASSVRLAGKHGAEAGSPKSAFLAFLVPASQLHIYNYDRVVTGLHGLSPDAFLERLRHIGPMHELPDGPGTPAGGHVQVLLQGRWYDLELAPPATPSAAETLEAARLNEQVLGPVLGITDLRTDPRVHFVPGTLGPQACERLLHQGKADVAFHLRPLTFGELRAVADSGACMPPKTTWIEPKLRSGLTIYPLNDV